MDAKTAQDMTEKRWLAFVSLTNEIGLCGWCLFAVEHSGGRLSPCHFCPVVEVFGESCINMDEYDRWETTGSSEAAQAIYDLLITYHEQLIAAGEAMDERSGRLYSLSSRCDLS